MIKHGVMHREFVELSKEIYVEIASSDYGLRGRPTNAARTALLTGLDRKEVSRLRKKLDRQEADAAKPDHRQDRMSRVLSGWHQDADYIGSDGKPLVIPLEGAAPSFAALVKRYGGDIPAITILRELDRVDAARASRAGGADTIEVLRRNYRLDTVEPASLLRAGSVLEDIGTTVTHNLYRDSDQESRFEARASNVALPSSSIPAYDTFIREQGQEFLERVDAWLAEHETTADGSEKTMRAGVGLYWIQSDASEVSQ